MKQIILSILIVATITSVVFSQNVNIPDTNFKAYLVGNVAINTNSDNEIQVSEANAYGLAITCINLSINDFTGLEAFTNLTAFISNGDNASSIDFTQNVALQSITIANAPIVNIDLSQNTALKFVVIQGTTIISLDLSQNTALEALYCFSNQLTSLDLTTNTLLSILDCSDNQLSSLNIANGNNTAITIFATNNNPTLSCIQVDDSTYSADNWTTIDPASHFSEDCSATTETNNYELSSQINIYPNPSQGDVNIESPIAINSIEVYNMSGQKMIENKGNINVFGLSGLSQGVYMLRIYTAEGLATKKIVRD